MGVLRVALFAILAIGINADRYHPEQPHKDTQRQSATRQNDQVHQFNTAERSAEFWKSEALAGIEKRIKEIRNDKVARNVIMFLGDGLSIPTMMAARTMKGQRQNRTGEETEMFFETFPTIGLSKTYCLDEQIPDSACTATAYLGGVKNNYGTTGVTGNVARNDCPASTNPDNHVHSIATWALEDGRDAGIVTTTRITHASPSGTYVNIANRNWEQDADVVASGFTTDVCPDIALQLVHDNPGDQFKVILGGGRRAFRPTTVRDEEGDAGRRTDGRDLIQEWQDKKAANSLNHQYVWNRSQLMSLNNSPPDYLLGLFESNHLDYHLEADPITEPTLAEMTEVAINMLRRNDKGFFLFVEGGRIDHAHHDTYPQLALDETLEFDKAIEKAVEKLGADDDTLIVVTADHAHVMAVNGYTKRGTDILGVSDERGDDNIPYMTLSYTNGPGARTHTGGVRPDVTQDNNLMDLRWRTHAEVYVDSETHGGDDVAVLAYGPHHHMFSGVYEQSQIPWRMAYAACIGPGAHSEYCNGALLTSPLNLLYVIALVLTYHVYRL